MKRIILLVFVFALASCSREIPSNEVTKPETTLEKMVTEAPTEASDEEAPPELVEESAAEPDRAQAKNQPLLLAPEKALMIAAAPTRKWNFKEGQDYHRLMPAQPTVGGADKIEVAEVFWYGCPHCYDFEPKIKAWAKDVSTNARFIQIPVVWNPLARLHARLYYSGEVLAKNGKLTDITAFHATVFNEYHRKRNRLSSKEAIQKLFGNFNISREDFLTTWDSFEVNQKINIANDLVRRYNITGVPAVVVNGKYRTGASDAGSYPKLLEILDELIERETIR
jgi:thiol:disulfide interchange protein DsbA